MTPNSQPATVMVFRIGASHLFFLGGAALLLGGCMATQKRPAFPWKTAAMVHPVIPSPLSPDDKSLPEVTSIPTLELPLPRVALLPARPVPPRPHVPAQPAAAGEADKQDGPLIVPQITAQESASAQQEINRSLSAAEKNLEAVRGKSLNTVQNDMSNKVKGFMNDAREAARAGDFTRARSLAKKAQVLSEELARSL